MAGLIHAREVVSFIAGIAMIVFAMLADEFQFAALGAGIIGVPGAFDLIGGRSLRVQLADKLSLEVEG